MRSQRGNHALPYLTVGVLGALVGGYLTRDIGGVAPDLGFNPTSLLSALIISILSVVMVHFLAKASSDQRQEE